jgi:hypothetical protein
MLNNRTTTQTPTAGLHAEEVKPETEILRLKFYCI